MAKPGSDETSLGEAIERWGRSLRSANKSEKTIRTYLDAAGKLSQHVSDLRPIDEISRDDHEAMLAALAEKGWKPASRATVFRSLRSFWNWAVDHDGMPVHRDPMNGMKAPAIPEESLEFVTDEQLRAIIATCRSNSRHNFRGHRDEAIIRLLASTGARLSEVADVRLEDVDLVSKSPVATVLGKGRRPRELPLDEPTFDAMRFYVTRERPRHPSASSDWLWLARAGKLTAGGIAQMVAERGIKAGVKRRVHPHELRHRFIATMLGVGLSEGDVMSLSGHRSRSMMDRYGRFTRSQRAHDAFRKAASSGVLPRL